MSNIVLIIYFNCWQIFKKNKPKISHYIFKALLQQESTAIYVAGLNCLF